MSQPTVAVRAACSETRGSLDIPFRQPRPLSSSGLSPPAFRFLVDENFSTDLPVEASPYQTPSSSIGIHVFSFFFLPGNPTSSHP